MVQIINWPSAETPLPFSPRNPAAPSFSPGHSSRFFASIPFSCHFDTPIDFIVLFVHEFIYSNPKENSNKTDLIDETMAERNVEHLVERLNLFEKGVKRMVFGKSSNGSETCSEGEIGHVSHFGNCQYLQHFFCKNMHLIDYTLFVFYKHALF